MSRARTLANYVSSGDELALKAPLISPALVTPNLGTPSAGVMTNMTGAVEASLVDNAVTLAKMAGGTDGNIISYDASGNPVAIATGDDGEVLTSTGAGSPPAFEAAGGVAGSSAFFVGKAGGWVTVATGSVAAFDSTSGHGFNTGSDFGSVESNAYTTPAAGVYIFGFHMYSNQSGSNSTWTFAINDTDLAITGGLSYGTHTNPASYSAIMDTSVCLSLGAGDEVDVRSEENGSTFYGTLSYFYGCRIS